MWNQYTDDNTFPLWPWQEERVNPTEYTRSLESLVRFLETVDVSQLQTVEDLSAVASLLGHNIRIITMVKGKKIEKQPAQLETGMRDPLYNVEREYVLTKFLRDQEFVVTAAKDHVCISEKRRIGLQGYYREELRVILPTDRDIAIGERPNVDEQNIYFIDLRDGRRRECSPVMEPSNPDIQQGFARVLKDAVRDFIAVLPDSP